jgi:two-component system, chemotaxis family, protein-glutamate methylesterase/glutaminase
MTDIFTRNYSAVVIGGSAGSIKAVCHLLQYIPASFPLPIIMALHRGPQQDSALQKVFAANSALPIVEPKGLTQINNSTIYLAPPDLHLMVEPDEQLTVVKSALVQYSRPSIDVLLFSAAEVYKENLIGILLTGANRDGAMGMKIINDNGGLTIVQNPEEAAVGFMPKAAMELSPMDCVMSLQEIADFLVSIATTSAEEITSGTISSSSEA